MKGKLKRILFNLTNVFEDTQAFIAIRQGLSMMIPLIVLGSFALTIKSLPIEAYQDVLPYILGGRFVEFLDFIIAGTLKIFSLALAVTTSISYARIKNVKSDSDRAVINDCFILVLVTLISLMGYMGVQKEGFSVESFGTTNTFMALLISLGCGWLYFGIKESKFFSFIRKPQTDMEGMYYIAVQGIIPAAIVVSIFAVFDQLFQALFHVNSVQEGLVHLLENILEQLGDGNGTGVIIVLAIHLMWFFGLHGSNVIDVVMQKNFQDISGAAIFNKTFQDVFVIMGGCGAALALVLAVLLFSRKKMMKNVAQLSFPSVIFNISEIIVFGLPIIFNPIFFLPFVLTPLVNLVVSYTAVYWGLVPRVINQVEWTAPVFLSGYQATGSVSGSILQLVCLCIDIMIYLPFIRLFEEHSDLKMKQRVKILVAVVMEEEETHRTSVLTNRGDMLGSIARMLATDLKDAVRNKELFMLYQPQVNANDKCIGAEALLRWNHPIVGFIYPPLIIRLAKEIGLLEDIEEQVFDMAAKSLSVLEKEIEGPCKISVNITNESLSRDDFEDMVGKYVEKYGISCESLWMEITEQEAFSSSLGITEKLQNLKKKGHKFLIDDFGMGHTSMLYLQTNTFDVVKIDASITKDIMENDRNKDILKSIIYLGELMKFSTIAEFAEKKEQIDVLKELGVDAFQGYYYSKPIPFDELLEWMKKR